MEKIQRDLDDRLIVDSLASEDGCYPIVTEYFETPDRECFWEKERRLASRRKIRVRIYGCEGGKILKTIKRDWTRTERMIIKELFDLVERRKFGPAIQLRYDRKALMTPDGQLRITFDTRLMCRSNLLPLEADDQRFEDYIIPANKSIFEVKSIGPVPFWFREYGGEEGLVRRSFSKFCTAMKEVDPVLRSQIGNLKQPAA